MDQAAQSVTASIEMNDAALQRSATGWASRSPSARTRRRALQGEGAKSFVKSWHELMEVIVSKSANLGKAS